MIPDKLLDVLKHEGVVAIATQGDNGPHLVNSWNSYAKVIQPDQIIIPAGYMNQTETNITKDNQVLITVGSREVDGFHGPGTGFLIKGSGNFEKEGSEFDEIKEKFPWARAALDIKVDSATQTL